MPPCLARPGTEKRGQYKVINPPHGTIPKNMKVYLMTVYYGQSTEERIFTTEKRAKQAALRWAKNTGHEVCVDELEPMEGQFTKVRTCGKYDKTSN